MALQARRRNGCPRWCTTSVTRQTHCMSDTPGSFFPSLLFFSFLIQSCLSFPFLFSSLFAFSLAHTFNASLLHSFVRSSCRAFVLPFPLSSSLLFLLFRWHTH